MRRTPSTPEKAAKSANFRLDANQKALTEAYVKDVDEGPEYQQRHQWHVATAWLRSEVMALTPQQRQQVLDHVLQLCRDVNLQARQTVVPSRSCL